MTETEVALVLQQGLAFTCAMCRHFWAARQPGAQIGRWQCQMALVEPVCRGPYQGGTFPHYQGPLTPSQRLNRCFRCGGETTLGIQFGDQPVIIGACLRCGGELGQWRLRQQPRAYPTLVALRAQLRG